MTPNNPVLPDLDPVDGLHAALVAGGYPFASRAVAAQMLAQGESAYSVRVKLQQQREADEALFVDEALTTERAAAEHVALDPARQLSARLDAWQRGQTDALLAAHGLPARRDVAAPIVAHVPAGALAAALAPFLRAA
jgi:hypothetical protein